MTAVEIAALKIDAYFGVAADVRPAVGGVYVPLRLAAELREAFAAEAARGRGGPPPSVMHPEWIP